MHNLRRISLDVEVNKAKSTRIINIQEGERLSGGSGPPPAVQSLLTHTPSTTRRTICVSEPITSLCLFLFAASRQCSTYSNYVTVSFSINFNIVTFIIAGHVTITAVIRRHH